MEILMEQKYYWVNYLYNGEHHNTCTTIHPFAFVYKTEYILLDWKRITAEDFNLWEDLHPAIC